MVRSWSAALPRTINPPTAPQPKPSTESCIPVRPKTRISIAVMPSVEVAREKLPQALACIVRCLAIVFNPVTEHDLAGLEVRVKESVVRAGIDDEFDRRAVVAPAFDLAGAVRRRRPVVERADEDQRRY